MTKEMERSRFDECKTMLQIIPATCAIMALCRTLICVNGKLLSPSLAMAALSTTHKPEVLAVAKNNAFIVDTGSGHHLVGRKHVSEKTITKVYPDKSLRLMTANGITTSCFKTKVYIKHLGASVEAWVLDDSPLVLSVDKLVAENGFDFAWKASTRKAVLSKNGQNHTLTIAQGVPLLAIT